MLADTPRSLQLDCSSLTQVSSRHVNLLWQAHLACTEAGVEMMLHEPSDGLIRVLRVLDLFHFFRLDDTCMVRHLREAAKPALTSGNRAYSDEFTAQPDKIDRAMGGFVEYLQQLRLPDMEAFELRTVFYEVAMNISGHGGIDSQERIVFSAVTDDEKMVMTFADSGVAFDPTVTRPAVDLRAAARGRQRRGFGLAMVSKLTDRMDYVRVHDAINLLTLEKRWSRA